MQFEKAPNLGRTLTQDDWKRTQIRMPQEQYEALVNYGKVNDISLNQAMIDLINKGLNKPKFNKKFIFTEWNALLELEDSSDFISHNEKVRMSCAEFMSDFFNDYPEHDLVKFEFKSRKQIINKKEQEILLGIRIWYTYPA